MDNRAASLEDRLVNLIQAVDAGDWYQIDLAMEMAKEVLGFDPTRVVGQE